MRSMRSIDKQSTFSIDEDIINENRPDDEQEEWKKDAGNSDDEFEDAIDAC